MFELIIPCSRFLLWPIYGFAKPTNMIRMISVCESLWLSHEDILNKGALQEGISNTELMEAPPMTSGERKNHKNSGLFHYRAEGVMIVNARPLM